VNVQSYPVFNVMEVKLDLEIWTQIHGSRGVGPFCRWESGSDCGAHLLGITERKVIILFDFQDGAEFPADTDNCNVPTHANYPIEKLGN
jgi:hypothetical protein